MFKTIFERFKRFMLDHDSQEAVSALGNLFKMHISCRKPVPCGLSRQKKERLLLFNQPIFVL